VPRAVLDSSVLISAFLTPHGVSAKLLDAAEQGTFDLCISHEILDEAQNSLRTKVKRIRRYYAYSDDQIALFIEGLAAYAELISDLPQMRVVPLDPKDDVIVATAIRAQAEYLVTGDRHLLSLGSYRGIQIVTPRRFLNLL
jgi:putative PIN family toxin of toxin-antitoxin system